MLATRLSKESVKDAVELIIVEDVMMHGVDDVEEVAFVHFLTVLQ